MNPPTIAQTKKAKIFKIIARYPPEPELTPKTIVKTIIPITSSIIAALTIVCPTSVLIFPSSFKTATEILTEVAVKIVPMNIDLKKFNVPKPSKPQKQSAIIVPIIKGTKTPIQAIIVDLIPDFTSDFKFVPKPAENIIKITPISAMYVINLFASL